MPQGITDLDRLNYGDLLILHADAVHMRDLIAAKIGKNGPLYNRIDGLVEDIEAARWWPLDVPAGGR